MISVVIETDNDEDALARTLSSLVAGAVEGIVREVIVCDRGSSDRTGQVADHAGCRFLANGDLEAAFRHARSEWLMLLQPGARLADGWMEHVATHAASGAGPARFTRSRHSRPPVYKRLLAIGSRRFEGLLIRREEAMSLARADADSAWIASRVSARRLAGEIHLPA